MAYRRGAPLIAPAARRGMLVASISIPSGWVGYKRITKARLRAIGDQRCGTGLAKGARRCPRLCSRALSPDHSQPQRDEPTAPEKAEKRQEQESEAKRREAPSGVIVYKTILKEGEDELDRSSSALFWSGLAAGLSMSFSMIGEGLLKAYLPATEWAKLIYGLGYSLGFMFVILGRQQLFTENTLTPILPLLQGKSVECLKNVARLWGIVLGANLLGGLLVSFVIARTPAFEPVVKAAFYELARTALEPSWELILLRGIFAGWMIALMVWLLPVRPKRARGRDYFGDLLRRYRSFQPHHRGFDRSLHPCGGGPCGLARCVGALRCAHAHRQRHRRPDFGGGAQSRPSHGGQRRNLVQTVNSASDAKETTMFWSGWYA